MLMPAGTKSLAVGKPFCVLLLVASPGLYTACPGWSTLGSSCLCYESEMRNAGTRTHILIFLLLLHARQAALCSGTTDSDSGAANRLQVAQIWAPGPKSQTCCSIPSFLFLFLSFYQLVTNHSLCLVSEWDSGWHRAILLALYRLPFQTICRSWGHGLLD